MVRIKARPGDTLPKGYDSRDIYIDVTVANITADTYIDKASKKRGSIQH